MNINGNNLPQELPCPDPETLVRYCRGELSPADQHRLEAHVLDCPLCEDALEGIGLMENPGRLISINHEIQASIAEMNAPTPQAKVIRFSPMRIAAIISLVLLSAATLWYLYPDKKSEALFTQEYKPYPPATRAPSEQTAPVEEAEKNTSAPEKPTGSIPVTATQQSESASSPTPDKYRYVTTTVEEVADEVALDKVASENKNDEGGTKETAEEQVQAAPASVQKQTMESDLFTGTSVSKNENVNQRKDEIKDKSLSQKKISAAVEAPAADKTADEFETGMNYYRDARYEEALNSFNKSYYNVEARFYAGVCNLSLNKPDEALKILRAYMGQPGAKNKEAAWWYIALAHVRKNETKNAKEALNEVLKFHGGFQQQAEELLRKL